MSENPSTMLGERPGHASDETTPEFFVVGVGASAGGLEALERLFEGLSPGCGLAFVVVQHLSPDFDSVMAELLARRTELDCVRVTNGIEVRTDTIYLMPPGTEMIISGGCLLLTERVLDQGLSLPIDGFFRSLAEDMGSRAAAVILSGSGSDGSRGVRAIHEAGGLVLVQSEETARFDGMPRSAIDTGIVDLILSPEELRDALIRYAKRPPGSGAEFADLVALSGSGDAMSPIFDLLRRESGIDFSHYKAATVGRRIERRLLLSRVESPEDYVRQLRDDPAELASLYKDLLIGVTGFFRDRDAFMRFGTDVLPELLERLGPDEDLRIWCAACATGEEAYSLALLAHEAFRKAGQRVRLKVFATDVHRVSLEVAGAGIYPAESLAGLPIELRDRYFTRTSHGDRFQVSPALRSSIVFAHHNVLRDAPFTRIDFVSCRNLLIYFKPAAQRKAISLFLFGLKAGGVMVLGPSETPGPLSDEFLPLDQRWKIYRKRRELRITPDLRGQEGGRERGERLLDRRSIQERAITKAQHALLERFTPPSLLVTPTGELLHSFGGGGRFLAYHDGRPSLNVLDLLDGELKFAVASALKRAGKGDEPAFYERVPARTPDGSCLVRVSVMALGGAEDNQQLLVTLEPATTQSASPGQDEMPVNMLTQERIETLEHELRHTQENLQATLEEMETSNEELQATNEELIASNEELQSTNEELQSVNEELYTVNAEYQAKIAELTELTTDMNHLLESTEVQILFLDKELCIRRLTPKIAETFSLLPQDIGRRIDSFTHKLRHEGIVRDLEGVLHGAERVEREVQDLRGRHYLLRVLPYRPRQTVEGVVLTLVDLSALKDAERELRTSEERARLRGEQMRAILDHAPLSIWVKDRRGNYQIVSRVAAEVLGARADLLIGESDEGLLPPKLASLRRERDEQVASTREVLRVEEQIEYDGAVRTYLTVRFPLVDTSGEVYAIAGIAEDITVRKDAEERDRTALKRRDDFLAMLSHELRNPLAAVLNATYTIERSELDTSATRSALDVTKRQALHMARLLDDLLDITRITLGKIEIRAEPLDLRKAAEAALQAVQPLVESKKLQLHVDLEPLPVAVRGDLHRLQQVQSNMLTNAAKFTPAGGRIWLSVRREGNQAVIRVRDSGVGLPKEDFDRVFELFYQRETTLDRSSGGIGVGLSLVQAVVGLHGGRVSASSDGPGRGSEFVASFPLWQGQLVASTLRPAASPSASPSVSRPLSIILVEDSDDGREMLEVLLMQDGHTVTSFCTGAEGAEAIIQQKPDLALVDIGLPEVNGYEVARRVRRACGKDGLYLVALTGYGRPEDQQAAFDAGFDEHVVKPIRPEILDRVVEGVVTAVSVRERPETAPRHGSDRWSSRPATSDANAE
ncbi:chemotaxis protein CheB [Chondromyces crocatus]|uniref:Histidine kinase n=1 Tax=Chondromyces crocatus TaxID=52 RepID=A0A0K1ECV2_CHOCO|nr:chemotaxis protein CheB [Chondromyces crocatus]AKT38669.1 histidine kinase [Chondromyces crocatus]